MSTELGVEQLEKIRKATEDVAVAQREVERAMLELTAEVPRAQKTIIGEVLKVAFARLAAAREKLESVSATAT